MVALGKAIGKEDGKVPVGLDFLKALKAWEKTIPADPGHRTFDDLRREASGRFSDDALAGIWADSIEDCAGSFGASHVPSVLRSVEILGMIQSRSWNLSSLNGTSRTD
jgi:linoleate 8R-lipoxygenase / 9,12-octadecadienoate 8-hydroperoxide 8R-isomerase